MVQRHFLAVRRETNTYRKNILSGKTFPKPAKNDRSKNTRGKKMAKLLV